MPEDPGLHAEARLHDESDSRAGLSDGHHGVRLHRVGTLQLVEWSLQRSLHRRAGSGNVREHADLQLVGMHGECEILRRLLR
jgi:hypothetical protein